MKRLVLGAGSPDIPRIRRALGAPPNVLPEGPPLPQSDAARRFWSERAWSECSAVPAMSQAILAMIREGCALDEMASLTRILDDEARHTELSRNLADAVGGYLDEIPGELPYDPESIARLEGVPLASWLVGNAISETVSAAMMQVRLRYTRHPIVEQLLRSIHRDEVIHARTAWVLLETVLERTDRSERAELGAQAIDLFAAVGSTFATSGLPSEVRSAARLMREETCALGLGAAPPDVADATCLAAISDVVIPRLTALGIETF